MTQLKVTLETVKPQDDTDWGMLQHRNCEFIVIPAGQCSEHWVYSFYQLFVYLGATRAYMLSWTICLNSLKQLHRTQESTCWHDMSIYMIEEFTSVYPWHLSNFIIIHELWNEFEFLQKANLQHEEILWIRKVIWYVKNITGSVCNLCIIAKYPVLALAEYTEPLLLARRWSQKSLTVIIGKKTRKRPKKTSAL